MYNRRSACSGSVSFEGFILLPQSHTLLREEVMLADSWISGWGHKSKGLIIKHHSTAAHIQSTLWISWMLKLHKSCRSFTLLQLACPFSNLAICELDSTLNCVTVSRLPLALTGWSCGPGAPSYWRPGSCLSTALRPGWKLEHKPG